MEKEITLYGNTEIISKNKSTYNPIQLEYYKTCTHKNPKPYGIGVIKTCTSEIEIDVEKREFNHIFSNENDANNILEVLLTNKVTPIALKDILEDLVLV